MMGEEIQAGFNRRERVLREERMFGRGGIERHVDGGGGKEWRWRFTRG